MSIVLAIIAIIIGVVGCVIIMFANGMSDAPSAGNLVSPWPWLIGCLVIAATLIGSHYVHWARIGW